MCGLFPATKAISPWKNFRDMALFNLEIGRYVGPSAWDQAKRSFCAVPQWKQQEWRGYGTGSCGKEA